ncbi:MAG: hypothetical protein WBA97_20205 [Actinophytocola sp.]|uniref:hypothetical protein n=1 Tax=Actinophytocola sp. TaxID=1872138 RepID=UPI003C77E42D
MAKHSLGLHRAPGDADVATLTDLLADGSFRTTAAAVADQVRALPVPAALVPRLEVLGGHARTTSATPVSTRG